MNDSHLIQKRESDFEPALKCHICGKVCDSTYKFTRHLDSHEKKENTNYLKLKHNGQYSCQMHDIKWVFETARELQVHYHTWHFKDDADTLFKHGIPKELVTDHWGRRIGKGLLAKVKKTEQKHIYDQNVIKSQAAINKIGVDDSA